MAYQIKQLAELAGVSVRTLRYYDEIGLLPPAYVGENGYRYYETAQVDQLQQIRLYRAMQVPLAEIKPLLTQSPAQTVTALEHQYQQLLAQRQQLDGLLTLIQTQTGGMHMTDAEKFTAFKQQKLNENERNYGEELRNKYDSQTLAAANDRFTKLSQADYTTMQTTEAQLLADLKTRPALDSPVSQRIYDAHKRWLCYSWSNYSAEMHRNLAAMYQADDRFQSYYDNRAGQGAAKLLCQIIDRYAKD